MMPEPNASIRFLMKEMDPAEEIVFCREMENSQDLQIEVESLRSTHQRLSAAPRFTPPPHIRSAVRQRADEFAAQRRLARMQRRFVQAAAVLVVSLSPTLFFLYEPDSSGSSGLSADSRSDAKAASPWVDRDARLTLSGWQASAPAPATGPAPASSLAPASAPLNASGAPLASPLNTPLSSAAGTASTAATAAASTASAVQEGIDSLYMDSFRKLRRLSGAVKADRPSAELQLTGSRRN